MEEADSQQFTVDSLRRKEREKTKKS